MTQKFTLTDTEHIVRSILALSLLLTLGTGIEIPKKLHWLYCRDGELNILVDLEIEEGNGYPTYTTSSATDIQILMTEPRREYCAITPNGNLLFGDLRVSSAPLSTSSQQTGERVQLKSRDVDAENEVALSDQPRKEYLMHVYKYGSIGNAEVQYTLIVTADSSEKSPTKFRLNFQNNYVIDGMYTVTREADSIGELVEVTSRAGDGEYQVEYVKVHVLNWFEVYFGLSLGTENNVSRKLKDVKEFFGAGKHEGLYQNTEFVNSVAVAVQDTLGAAAALGRVPEYLEHLNTLPSGDWPVNKLMGALFASVFFYCDKNRDGMFSVHEFMEFARKTVDVSRGIHASPVKAVVESILGLLITSFYHAQQITYEDFSRFMEKYVADKEMTRVYYFHLKNNVVAEDAAGKGPIPIDLIQKKFREAKSVEQALKLLFYGKSIRP